MMILPRIAIVIQTLRVTSCAEFSEKTDPQKALASVCVSEKQGASREHPHSDDSVGVVESVPACIPTEAKPRISFERSSRSELVLDSALYPYKFDSQALGGPAIVTKGQRTCTCTSLGAGALRAIPKQALLLFMYWPGLKILVADKKKKNKGR